MSDRHPPRPANLYVLSAAIPGKPEVPIGVLLEDIWTNSLQNKLRGDWHAIAPGYEDYLAPLADDLFARAEEMGAKDFLAMLTSQLSNFLRITDPEPLDVSDLPAALQDSYTRYIQS
jgi:hypothetical protein